ncbi:hypothetical protein TPHA_0C02080 [Tetrapisispora phaffii CBS 4417]|uniref:Ribosome assembly protein 3 n=1 Tax=Tetrapisispora phaffii (strain ATCC 24235 / CBS 4417 / NBRC 1672 / NRRL Y-8282 / UCD 70-5) TaxID=1071381 RepID=G8BRI7_TETPH|nr:hypothetical protein TPHA_0C02080 [Tetrapisispora phaffii CBS 4417]CCE62363.1 hypothetical protein TPHA_0C02080 [Tetrapisispora phaffii CBS 4417]
MGEVSTAVKRKRNNKRRNKKRTAISDSDDSSFSDNEITESKDIVAGTNESETVNDEVKPEITQKYESLELSDNEISDIEMKDEAKEDNVIANDKYEEISNIEDIKNKLDSKKADNQLKNEYLNLLFTNYGDDVNSLREAPDFSTKSLSILANVLKDGTKMFDQDTLRSILETK